MIFRQRPIGSTKFSRSLAIFLFCLAFPITALHGQNTEQIAKEETGEDRISLLAYVRVIRNDNGTFRIDENIVPNFRLNKLLRLELGLRQGETSSGLGAYNHYKVELQTKFLW